MSEAPERQLDPLLHLEAWDGPVGRLLREAKWRLLSSFEISYLQEFGLLRMNGTMTEFGQRVFLDQSTWRALALSED